MSHAAARPAHPYLLVHEPYVCWEPAGTSEGSAATGLQYVTQELLEACLHYIQPASRRLAGVEGRFMELAETWRRDTSHLSSVTEMAMHPAYQQIIGLGWAAVPRILRELERRPDHWFWALKAITGIDPVPALARGRIAEMAAAWIQWGRDQGVRW